MFEINYKEPKPMIKSLQPYLKYEEIKEPELSSTQLTKIKQHSSKRNKTKLCGKIVI